MKVIFDAFANVKEELLFMILMTLNKLAYYNTKLFYKGQTCDKTFRLNLRLIDAERFVLFFKRGTS